MAITNIQIQIYLDRVKFQKSTFNPSIDTIRQKGITVSSTDNKCLQVKAISSIILKGKKN